MALVLLATTTSTQPVQSPVQLVVTIMVFIPIYVHCSAQKYLL
jgi:uncharacterized membrane protein YgaE (UPF0421/DUF939 family)